MSERRRDLSDLAVQSCPPLLDNIQDYFAYGLELSWSHVNKCDGNEPLIGLFEKLAPHHSSIHGDSLEFLVGTY